MTNKNYQILLPIAIDQPFTYGNPLDLNLALGDFVEVPFRGKSTVGVVWSLGETSYQGQTKPIQRKLDYPALSGVSREFITWVSQYTLSPLGTVLKMALVPDLHKDVKTTKPLQVPTPDLTRVGPILRDEQAEAATALQESIRNHTYKPFLLDGITGSGKTEVYMAAVEEALTHKRQVLVLLPEIALTSQWLRRFEDRFGCLPLQWHSTLTPSQRRQTWRAVATGTASVIVGARSALFLPYKDLGLIIVDEEHDPSFKQEEQVLYHARDMAVVRAHLQKIPIVLASATPSLESMVNVQSGRYHHLQLKHRHGNALLPTIEVADMRASFKTWVSPLLQNAIGETLEAREQVILFLNRRGYAPLTLCNTCGYRLMCPGCTSWLVEHKRHKSLRCHYCEYTQSVPTHCPECKTEAPFIPCGPGVERIHEKIVELFPEARCEVLTSDTASTPQQIKEVLDRISNHQVDIIIGTQILAKGHHFPLITLVGVIDADLGLSGGDLRGCERTYQLLHQVSGRAGREQRPGKVILQTFNPAHPVIKALATQSRDQFVEAEIYERERHGMPPHGRLASILVSGLKLDQVERVGKQLARSAPQHPDITVLGPVPAPLSLLRGRHRWRLLVKAPKSMALQPLLKEWVGRIKLSGNTRITVDIDPHSFL